MKQETIRYQADGLSMASQLFYNERTDASKRPGVLVFPEINGLGAHSLERAQRLAQLGFVALAADIHGENQEVGDIGAVLATLANDPAKIRARATGALAALLAHPTVEAASIVAIGFCFGGTMALELARSGADLKGVVGFHSGLATKQPQDASQIKGKVLVCIGASDPIVPPDQRSAFEQEMQQGGVDWQLHVYGGVYHSFTNPAADAANRPEMVRYDAVADARSWQLMHQFFQELALPFPVV